MEVQIFTTVFNFFKKKKKHIYKNTLNIKIYIQYLQIL